MIETDRGQFLRIANWIQNLNHRECVMKRYITEQKKDKYVVHVPKTRDYPRNVLKERLERIKERLLKEKGVPLVEAIEIVNNRTLRVKPVKQPSL